MASGARKKLFLLHEHGEPSHYVGAVEALKEFQPVFVEFMILKAFAGALKARSGGRFLKAVRDFLLLTLVFVFPGFIKQRFVVVGIAPFNWRMILLGRVLRDAFVVYHTSWARWDTCSVPRRPPALIRRGVMESWRKFLMRSHAIAAVTPEVKTSLVQENRAAAHKIEVVFHAFDEKVFFPDQQKQSTRPSLRLLYVGRLVTEKGIEDVIHLARKFPNAEVVVAGKGPLESTVREAVSQISNLKYIGYVSERTRLGDLFRFADILLLPSRRTANWEEVFGMVLIEAMACGCVPLVTDHIGPKTILGDCELGSLVLFPEAGFTECTSRFIENVNQAELGRLGALAVVQAQEFGLRSITARWSTLFEHAKRRSLS